MGEEWLCARRRPPPSPPCAHIDRGQVRWGRGPRRAGSLEGCPLGKRPVLTGGLAVTRGRGPRRAGSLEGCPLGKRPVLTGGLAVTRGRGSRRARDSRARMWHVACGMRACTCARMYVCLPARMHVRMYACTYVCMHACMSAHVYVYLSVCGHVVARMCLDLRPSPSLSPPSLRSPHQAAPRQHLLVS